MRIEVTTEREPALTRLELAKREAITRVERLFGGGLFAGGAGVMVIAFADRAEIRVPFSDNRAAVVEAIRSIEATDGATLIGEAIELARAFTMSAKPDEVDPASLEPPAIEVYSDGRIADLGEQTLKPGETVTLPIPLRAESLSLRLPDGTSVPVATRPTGEFSYGPLRAVGIYEASWTEPGREGRQSRRFAVNLLDPFESDLAAAAELPLGNDTVTGRAVDANARSSLWPWVIGLSLVLVLVEWWVYLRRAG
jgi:hypothetical protein